MPQLIPTIPDSPNYQISTSLDGTDYVLTFRYSGRANCFYLDLYDIAGNLLIGGRKLVSWYPIWRIFRYVPTTPQGVLVAMTASGTNDGPAGFDANGFGELGDGRRVQLYYFSPSELPLNIPGDTVGLFN